MFPFEEYILSVELKVLVTEHFSTKRIYKLSIEFMLTPHTMRLLGARE
jgi:hypothetical protein